MPRYALFYRTELKRLIRIMAASLLFVSGSVLILQARYATVFPPIPGHVQTKGTVLLRQLVGTFKDPAFFVTVSFNALGTDGTTYELRSGQRVSYDQYHALQVGDHIALQYDANNPYNWQLIPTGDTVSQYGLGVFMMMMGIFGLTLPSLINWAVRQDDFAYSDQTNLNPNSETSEQNYVNDVLPS